MYIGRAHFSTEQQGLQCTLGEYIFPLKNKGLGCTLGEYTFQLNNKGYGVHLESTLIHKTTRVTDLTVYIWRVHLPTKQQGLRCTLGGFQMSNMKEKDGETSDDYSRNVQEMSDHYNLVLRQVRPHIFRGSSYPS